MREMTPLCELARKHETDKGGRHYRYGGQESDTCHEYTPVYWDLFGERRDSVKHVLEVGVNAGSSLRMWKEFFPNAEIVGFDIRTEVLFNEDRIRCIGCDQSNPHSLVFAMSQIGADKPCFDMIVDDGSHEVDHQITTMQWLLPFLKKDGYYVIEDLGKDCQPEIITTHIPDGYQWVAVPCPDGLGKAQACGCGCGRPEQLLVIRVAQ